MVRMSAADAARELARRDPVIATMVERHGPPNFRGYRTRRPHFAALARAVCFQQLAGKAAASIHGRFEALFEGHPTPDAVLALPESALRAVGLSGSKVASIRDLAEKAAGGSVRLHRIARLDDAEVVAELVQVRGIGEWTAQMFLMFQLGRLDVWPTGDYGVRNGWARLHGLAEMPTPKELAPLADEHRPYRSVVAWYCWRAVDTVAPG